MITNDVLRILLWLLATLEISIALYVLVLNPRNKINRNITGLMLIFAGNSFGLGVLLSAANLKEATLPFALLASTSVPTIVMILIVTLVLLFPEPPRWLNVVRWVLYALVLLPIITTLIDSVFGSVLWLNFRTSYAGGYVAAEYYANGVIGRAVRAPVLYGLGTLTVLPSLVVLFLRGIPRSRKRLAGLLLVSQLLTIFLQVGLRNFLTGAQSATAVNVVFAVVYGYATFDLLFRDRTMQTGRLQTRLTLLSLVVTLPVLILVGAIVGQLGRELLIEGAQNQLQITNNALKSNVKVWLDQNVRALQQLAVQPEVRSMDPELQKPMMELMTRTYPYMYLISSTDLAGINVARSDAETPKDYSDRVWFRSARSGQEVTFQTVIGRTSGEPALVVSVPIRGENLRTVGVLMFAATLEDLKAAVDATQAQESGLDFYVVDAQDSIVLASDSAAERMASISKRFIPVQEFYFSGPGQKTYSDDEGVEWLAYVDALANDWIVVVEREQNVLLQSADFVRNNNVFIVSASIILLTGLIYATVRQSLRPIGSLTDTVGAIIEGDLTQRAPIESSDELGTLAESFNVMTDRLNEQITGLEDRVEHRTAALEQRSRFLQASAEVGRAASSILDADTLFREVVELIRDRFNLYYVGLFLLDEAQEWAVLRAGTGQAGHSMLARNHRILVGTGMVGWSIANNQSRVASRAEADVVRLAATELPDTRSEAALPLASRGTVLGALTVQSTQPDVFDADTLTVLQTMADQIAVAIDNARLYTSMQETLQAERRSFGQTVTASLQGAGSSANDWAYDLKTGTFMKPSGTWRPEMMEARRIAGTVIVDDPDAGGTLSMPIKVRDEVIGVLDLNRTSGDAWTRQEIGFLETIAEQMGAALESALLYETSQRRASREQLIRQITENISSASTVEDAMRRAMLALADVANARQVAVRIGSQQTLLVKRGDTHE